MVEITSTDRIREDHAAAPQALLPGFPGAEAYLLSRDPNPQRIGAVLSLPWQEGVLAL